MSNEMKSKVEGEKRFYWIEGVTRDEVIRSLTDQRPTRLRQQGVRRALVVVYSLLIGFLTGAQHLIPMVKLRTYLEIAGLAGVLWLYYVLRTSVRHISDAPDELLDERLIQMRNAAYLHAYRILVFVTLPFIMQAYLMAKVQGGGFDRIMTVTLLPFLMLAATLPAMVLAWTLPTEEAGG
jgi:hypothetical protein